MTLASCDSRKTAGENPFFTQWDTPHGVPPFDKILPEHFMPAFERGMSLHEAEIDAITSNKDEATFENTILAYDNAGQMLAQAELVFGMLCAAETNDRMQALQEQAMPLLAAHRDKIRLDDKLFARVKEVYDRRAALELDAEQMRLLQKTYDSFVRAGALLGPELMTDDGLLTQQGSSTFWDRSTLYALRGIYNVGQADRATELLHRYSQRRLLGDHVPYPIEAWPEGSQRHLSAESGLYCRIITEGLFGIRPTGLRSFDLTPSMPAAWESMSLRHIRAFGSDFDITVARVADGRLRITVARPGAKPKIYRAAPGATIRVKLTD